MNDSEYIKSINELHKNHDIRRLLNHYFNMHIDRALNEMMFMDPTKDPDGMARNQGQVCLLAMMNRELVEDPAGNVRENEPTTPDRAIPKRLTSKYGFGRGPTLPEPRK